MYEGNGLEGTVLVKLQNTLYIQLLRPLKQTLSIVLFLVDLVNHCDVIDARLGLGKQGFKSYLSHENSLGEGDNDRLFCDHFTYLKNPAKVTICQKQQT